MNRKRQPPLGRSFALAVLIAVVGIETTSAQQNAGDKELGLNATVSANHGVPFTGTAFASANFRQLYENPKLSRFVGIGGGGQFSKQPKGAASVDPNLYGEFGLKLSLRSTGGGFGQKTQSIILLSIRHLF